MFTLGQFGLSGIVITCVCLSVCVCVCDTHKFVRAITHHSFKLGSPNLDGRWKYFGEDPCCFCGTIGVDTQGQIQLRIQISRMSRFSTRIKQPAE